MSKQHIDDGMSRFEKAMLLIAAVFSVCTLLMLFVALLANFLVAKGVL